MLVGVGIGATALATALGVGPTPPPKPLPDAIHDALTAGAGGNQIQGVGEHVIRAADAPAQFFQQIHGAQIRDGIDPENARGIRADWTALVDGWRAVYAAS
ncbi:MAG: hypothetical protein ABSH36_08540, partial [Solirubrobacteraceae bacterium]